MIELPAHDRYKSTDNMKYYGSEGIQKEIDNLMYISSQSIESKRIRMETVRY